MKEGGSEGVKERRSEGGSCFRKEGLHSAANFRKRAIQFGSRTAQMANKLTFGSNRQGSGDVQYRRVWECE